MLASCNLLLIKCSTKAQRSCTSAHRMLHSSGNPPQSAYRSLTRAGVASPAWAWGRGKGYHGVEGEQPQRREKWAGGCSPSCPLQISCGWVTSHRSLWVWRGQHGGPAWEKSLSRRNLLKVKLAAIAKDWEQPERLIMGHWLNKLKWNPFSEILYSS